MSKWILIFLAFPCFAMASESPTANQKEMVAKFNQLFNLMDTDKSGKLSKSEVELKAPALAENFEQIDADHDGGLTKKEIRDAVALAEKRRLAFSHNLAKADKDHNGKLTREEAKILPNISANFDAIDSNHDGELVLKEIADYVRAKANETPAHATSPVSAEPVSKL